MRKPWVHIVFGLALAGCGTQQPATEGESAAASQWVLLTRAAADSAAKAEKYTGMWTVNQIAKRLVEAGFGVAVTDSVVVYPFLSVPGRFIHLGRGDVHVFIYPDTTKSKQDFDKLDPATAAPPDVKVDWPAPVTLVRSLNAVVIFLSNSATSSERLENAILGGLMPPETGK